jgi:hypothetical protein
MRFDCGQRQRRDLYHPGFVPANDATLGRVFYDSALLADEAYPVQWLMLIVVVSATPLFILTGSLSANFTEQQISFSHATHTASLGY